MHIDPRGPRRFLYACAAIATLHAASVAVDATPAAAALRPVSAVLGPGTAQAQTTWGVARRTARRTTRRVMRREAYYYGAAATTAAATAATVAADQCYWSDNRRYCPQMVGGEVVYVVVT